MGVQHAWGIRNTRSIFVWKFTELRRHEQLKMDDLPTWGLDGTDLIIKSYVLWNMGLERGRAVWSVVNNGKYTWDLEMLGVSLDHVLWKQELVGCTAM